ncbi:MAG TPA: phosphatidate cytidylyltransferase [Candidatus Limnocylindria bacterium]
MKDLRRRTLTALIYGAVVLVALFAAEEVFYAVLALIVGLAAFELAGLRHAGPVAVLELIVLAAGTAALVWLRINSERVFGPARVPSELLMTFLAVWAADVAAYAVGSSFGRRKIVPRISPGKTWEGTIAGFVVAAAVVILWNRPFLAFPAWAFSAAILIGPVAFAGDLLESWAKRRAGVKDSGTLLPGHGGILDRIDSLVAAAPVVAGTMLLLGSMG